MDKRKALKLVILLGFVSLFADVTYEGARSIAGQYFSILGASGLIVGTVAGFGELVGYSFRLASGYLSDKTGRYWLITFIGFALNLFAVPLLALAGNWQVAAGLIILERFGKAIRTPSRDAILSYATNEVGRGWGFGLHHAMDQVGGLLGPLLISASLYYHNSYQTSFALLLIPAILAMSVLVLARVLYPRPQELEVESLSLKGKGISKKYWLYIAAVSAIAAGFVDFPLIAYHFKKLSIVSDAEIPLLFAVAMGFEGISALLFGRLFDKLGISILIVTTALSALFAPFVFTDSIWLILIGIMLWGIGMGAQESIIRAFVAQLISKEKRATAYGLLHIWFGVFWFLGSALMGYLYDVSLPLLIIFSVVAQLIAIPLFVRIHRLRQ